MNKKQKERQQKWDITQDFLKSTEDIVDLVKYWVEARYGIGNGNDLDKVVNDNLIIDLQEDIEFRLKQFQATNLINSALNSQES